MADWPKTVACFAPPFLTLQPTSRTTFSCASPHPLPRTGGGKNGSPFQLLGAKIAQWLNMVSWLWDKGTTSYWKVKFRKHQAWIDLSKAHSLKLTWFKHWRKDVGIVFFKLLSIYVLGWFLHAKDVQAFCRSVSIFRVHLVSHISWWWWWWWWWWSSWWSFRRVAQVPPKRYLFCFFTWRWKELISPWLMFLRAWSLQTADSML